MSWMDSWSRPNKSTATPPPLYITNLDTTYCKSCGRVINDRRSHQKTASKSSNKPSERSEDINVVRYCSDGCRRRRIGPLDKKIDRMILTLLEGESGSGIENIDVKSRMKKGDHRILISTDEIEQAVFERAPQTKEVLNGGNDVDAGEVPDPYEALDDASMDSQGNRPNPTGPGSAEKRQEGQRRAEEREAVRRAARRAVVFGLAAPEQSNDGKRQDQESISRKKCEAVINGQVVEPSYAKGNWYIRWRD